MRLTLAASLLVAAAFVLCACAGIATAPRLELGDGELSRNLPRDSARRGASEECRSATRITASARAC